MENKISNIGSANNTPHDLKDGNGKKNGEDGFYQAMRPESDGNVTPNMRQAIEEKFKTVKKAIEREVDQYASDLKSLEVQLVKFGKEMENKVDKSYVDTLEASLNALIKQTKGSNSITSVLKELAEDIITIKERLGMRFNAIEL